MFKAAKESNGGTVSNAWHFVAEDMEATADTHKSIASLLVEEIVKPLKMFAEAQHRTRKSVESLLEKGRSSKELLHYGTIYIGRPESLHICKHIWTYCPCLKKSHFLESVQGSAKRRSPGLVNFVAAVDYHFCLALPAAFTQSGARP